MNGVLFDTREPGTTQPIKRAISSWWWGTALALSGLMCCILPPLEWRTGAFAQTATPRAQRPLRPRMVPISDDEDTKTREPWQVLTQPEEVNENPIVEILIEGNVTIPDASILRLIKTRKGRPATPKGVREDVKALFETRWFTGVTPIYTTTDKGTVLKFRVIEAPILDAVTYVGNKRIKTRVLEGVTGLRKGGPFGTTLNREAAKAIERYYKDKGYHFCKVTLQKGDVEDDRQAVFEIVEGPKTYVNGMRFEGNEFFTPGELKLHLKTSKRLVYFIPLGGNYNPSDLDDDVSGLREYYQKVGFLEAKITAKPEFAEDKAYVTMVYSIVEGTRFKVGKILIRGNDVIEEATLRKDFKLEENNYFNSDKLTRDVDGMTDKYGAMGRLFAEVNATPIFLPEQPGVVDIVYKINEDKVYRVRRVDVMVGGGNGNPSHTKDTVVLNQMLVVPGDLANKTLIKKSERRIASSSYFANAQSGTPPRIEIRKVNGVNSRPPMSGLARAQEGYTDEQSEPQSVPAKQPVFPIPIFNRNPPANTNLPENNEAADEDSGSNDSSTMSNLRQQQQKPATARRGASTLTARPVSRTAALRQEATESESAEQRGEETVVAPVQQKRRAASPAIKVTPDNPSKAGQARPKAGRVKYDASQSNLENLPVLNDIFNNGGEAEPIVATTATSDTEFA
ncbi:MAG: outer membrane protein assembly complex, YaeT protein, partial [Planctomycetaceae bacterium]|nr:outer membrane protein assembly complex, YaeT protein [Planctomycetaceae bacterium]